MSVPHRKPTFRLTMFISLKVASFTPKFTLSP